MIIACIKVDPFTGALLSQCKLSISCQTSRMRVDQQQIEQSGPIGLQINQGKLYLYLNATVMVALPAKKLQEVCLALQKCGMAHVKVPAKSTQILAQVHQSQGGCLVHCGTFGYLHECFVIFRYPHSLQIRDSQDRILTTCGIKQVGFNDQKQAIGMSQGPFYFWKHLSYLEFKSKILECFQLNIVHTNSQNQQKQCMQIDIDKQQNIEPNQQPPQISMDSEQKSCNKDKEQENNEEQEQKIIIGEPIGIKQSVFNENEMVNEYEGSVEQNQSSQEMKQQVYQSTHKKPISNNQTHQATTAKKQSSENQMMDEDQENHKYINNGHELFEVDRVVPIKPTRLQMEKPSPALDSWRNTINSQDSHRQMQKQNGHDDNLMEEEQKNNNRIYVNAHDPYSTNQYSSLLCCQHQCNVIDMQKQGSKHILRYHKFGEDPADELQIITSFDIFTIEHKVGLQSWNINPTKLVYDVQTNCIFYNDPNLGYLYSCSIRQQCQFSYFTYLPVLDLTRHRKQSVLAIQQNSIFELDTRSGKKNELITYKTINNLIKVAGMFDQNFYATASSDGTVRTYDIRSRNQALNKFEMQPGITSLKISREGNYIMCGYGDKAQILSCKDKTLKSVFQSKTRKADRKKAKDVISGHDNLSHMQFIKGNQQGNIMALDDRNNNLVVKNVESPSILQRLQLKYADGPIAYINSHDNWIVYGCGGNYHRQLFS